MEPGTRLKIEKVGSRGWALTGVLGGWPWPVDERYYSNAAAVIRRRRALVALKVVGVQAPTSAECDPIRDEEVYVFAERGTFVSDEWNDRYNLYLDSDWTCVLNPDQPCANCIEMGASQFADA